MDIIAEQMNIPPQEWGMGNASAFISNLHNEPNDTIDPSKVKLAQPFVVCIIGASGGIGAGIARTYAKAGASGIILVSRKASSLETTAAQCRELNEKARIESIVCDLVSAEAVSALAVEANNLFERLDVVIVNSGYSGPAITDLLQTDPSTFQTAINVNYVGTFHCIKYLVPLLLETKNGANAFIAVNSLASLILRGGIANAQYCVSKLAQLRLMEHLHEQHFRQGLRSFSIHPGAVASEMAEGAPDFFKDALVDSPELCGAFCVWLTKDVAEKEWLSGRLLSVNWDADELDSRKEEVVEKDLLKLAFRA
jgi:NAD(P)-dependent dehydrogenase (short-subunit alcohol dehydrogenase family)